VQVWNGNSAERVGRACGTGAGWKSAGAGRSGQDFVNSCVGGAGLKFAVAARNGKLVMHKKAS